MFMRVVVFAGLTVLVATQLPAYLQDRADSVPETPSQAASLEATRLAVAHAAGRRFRSGDPESRWPGPIPSRPSASTARPSMR